LRFASKSGLLETKGRSCKYRSRNELHRCALLGSAVAIAPLTSAL
jgi:hypothetical protein